MAKCSSKGLTSREFYTLVWALPLAFSLGEIL